MFLAYWAQCPSLRRDDWRLTDGEFRPLAVPCCPQVQGAVREAGQVRQPVALRGARQQASLPLRAFGCDLQCALGAAWGRRTARCAQSLQTYHSSSLPTPP